MAGYRIYAMTPDGHIRSAADIEAENDGEAIQLARLRLERADIELWCGARRIARLPREGLPIVLDATASEPRRRPLSLWSR